LYEEARALINDEDPDPVIRALKNTPMFATLHQCLFDIVFKKPISSEGSLAKLDNAVNKIKCHFSAPVEEPKAIVRLRIPMMKVVEDIKNQTISSTAAKDMDDSVEKEDVELVEELPQVEEWKEVDLEDKALMINPRGEQYALWIFH
jgi:hypothetical protein